MTKHILILLLCTVLLNGCQTRYQRTPFTAPANATVIQATFKHLAISQAGLSSRLHVYIEGDGIPFPGRFQIAKDPSPSYPLMLQLMAFDNGNSLFLGRPCYFPQSLPAMLDARCDAKLWTSARYSDEVVNSMVMALRTHLNRHPAEGVSLIGHSGGGTLAMLMAARMSEVDQIATLAGNLDTTSWTRLHYYNRLKNSLNPADLPASSLPRKQLHFVGDRDDNIPPTLTEAVLAKLGQRMTILKNADHNCCWQAHWHELLAQINRQAKPTLN